jgi:hypothetical protein
VFCCDECRNRNKRENVTDVYVKSQLCQRTKLTFIHIPAALVRLKRAQILLKREVKKHEQRNRND